MHTYTRTHSHTYRQTYIEHKRGEVIGGGLIQGPSVSEPGAAAAMISQTRTAAHRRSQKRTSVRVQRPASTPQRRLLSCMPFLLGLFAGTSARTYKKPEKSQLVAAVARAIPTNLQVLARIHRRNQPPLSRV